MCLLFCVFPKFCYFNYNKQNSNKQVTVISPHKYKKVPQGVSEIAIDATEWNNFQNSVSDELLTNRNAGMPFSQVHIFRKCSFNPNSSLETSLHSSG